MHIYFLIHPCTLPHTHTPSHPHSTTPTHTHSITPTHTPSHPHTPSYPPTPTLHHTQTLHHTHTHTPSHTYLPHTHRPVNLEVSLPTMESHVDFTAHFPQGCQAANCLQEKVDLPCTLEFSSSQPVSRTDHITFSDKTTGKRCVSVCVGQLSHLEDMLCMLVAGVQLLHL